MDRTQPRTLDAGRPATPDSTLTPLEIHALSRLRAALEYLGCERWTIDVTELQDAGAATRSGPRAITVCRASLSDPILLLEEAAHAKYPNHGRHWRKLHGELMRRFLVIDWKR